MTVAFQAPATTRLLPDAGWLPALTGLGLSLALAVSLYFATYADMVSIWWRSGTFNHCFLILPISLYLIHQRRDELLRLSPRPSALGLLALLAAGLLWGLGQAADVMVAQHLAVVLFWPLCAWALLGDRIAWRLQFPLAFLLFSVPTGEALVPTLQDVTAHFAVKLLNLSGIPVLLEGRHISVPNGDFVVAEACSGINYLIASLALGTIYAYLQYRSRWRRLAFVALSLMVPIVANGIRAYGIILIAHLSDMRLAVGIDHIIYGWLFFGLVILLMFWLGNFFREDLEPAAATDAPKATSPGPKPVLRLAYSVLSLVMLASGWGLARWLDAGADLAPARIALPQVEGEWHGPSASDDPLGGTYAGAQSLVGVYDSADGSLFLRIAYYAREHQGVELINTDNALFDRKRWERVSESDRDLPGTAQRVHVWRLRGIAEDNARQEMLVYSWFDVAGTRTTSEVTAKLAAVLARLTRKPGGQAAVILAAPVGARLEDSQRLLDGFRVRLAEPLERLTQDGTAATTAP